MTDEPIRIAFVCVENAGRSQMAAAFAEQQVAERGLVEAVEIVSGGTEPADHVHDVVVEAMAERGIDVGGRTPRAIPREEILTMDHVVIMGCSARDVCPATWRGDARDWALDDPAGRSLGEVRAIRADIEGQVGRLLDEIEADRGVG